MIRKGRRNEFKLDGIILVIVIIDWYRFQFA